MFSLLAYKLLPSFQQPANDPYGVTKDQLCEGLRQCLASSAHFAEYCMPLLQEKLESDLVSAKVEALKTLVNSSVRGKISNRFLNVIIVDFRNCVASPIIRRSLRSGLTHFGNVFAGKS